MSYEILVFWLFLVLTGCACLHAYCWFTRTAPSENEPRRGPTVYGRATSGRVEARTGV
jgi:hypothetical protein